MFNRERDVYLDNAATTRVDPLVAKEVMAFFEKYYANPHGIHFASVVAEDAIEKAREKVAKVIEANPEDIIFTSGGTESDNLAIIGTARAVKQKGTHIITTAIEHPAVTNTCKYLQVEMGFDVTYLPVDRTGRIDIEEFKKAIRNDTVLITVMSANNEIGTIQPIKEIGEIASDKGILFHTDAVQAYGKIPIDVNAMNIDLLSISGHKVHAPKGIGALYMKNGGKDKTGRNYLRPISFGGGQERGFRSGTANVPGIVGLGKAAEIILNNPQELERERKLCEKIIQEVIRLGNSFINGHPIHKLPNIVNFGFRDLNGSTLLKALSERYIFCSTGSACSAKTKDVSPVLSACGVSEPDIFGCLRWSLSRFTIEKDVDYALSQLKAITGDFRMRCKNA